MTDRETSDEIAKLTRRLGSLLDELDERREKNKQMEAMLGGAKLGRRIVDNFDLIIQMSRLSTLEHKMLQGFMYDAHHGVIGNAAECAEGTVRNGARTLRHKLGVASTAELGALTEKLLQNVDEERYQIVSGGLSKRWGVDNGLADLSKVKRRIEVDM